MSAYGFILRPIVDRPDRDARVQLLGLGEGLVPGVPGEAVLPGCVPDGVPDPGVAGM